MINLVVLYIGVVSTVYIPYAICRIYQNYKYNKAMMISVNHNNSIESEIQTPVLSNWYNVVPKVN